MGAAVIVGLLVIAESIAAVRGGCEGVKTGVLELASAWVLSNNSGAKFSNLKKSC